MSAEDRLRAELGAAVSGDGGPLAMADRLCQACVDLLEVDGASISLTVDDANRGTFGSSSPLSRHVDELQFTFGEGPCHEAVRSNRPVLVADLADPVQTRWPAFAGAVLQAGIGAVFALPVRLAAQPVGALDLFRTAHGPLSDRELSGGLLAAELAALPLLDLLTGHAEWRAAGQPEDGWTQLAALERVEVYQAVGMIMGVTDVDATEALVRLRAHAFTRGLTATQVAWGIVERRVLLDPETWSDLGETGPGR